MARVLIVSARDLGPTLGRTVLWRASVERLVASCPNAAFDVVRSFVPNLVVVDAADAVVACQFVRLLRESPGTRRSSIVVVGPPPAFADEPFQQAGANLVLRGPVDPEQWDDGLKRLLSVSRRVRTGLAARFVARADGAAGAPVNALALDVSIGGVLLEAPSAPGPGALLDEFLTLPDAEDEWRASGKAVWVAIGPPARVGVARLPAALPARGPGRRAPRPRRRDHDLRRRRRLLRDGDARGHDAAGDAARQGRLDPEELRRILGPVAEALDYAHALGTIHRDIKPANIMVLADGRPKVMDFGVAHLSAAITADGQFVGSPAYMAPEQIRSSQATPATDRFSLAIVAYEALTGRKPFEGDSVTPILFQVLNSDPPSPTSLNPALPAAYDEVFRRALAKDPAARFESARGFVSALGEAPEGGAWAAPPQDRPLAVPVTVADASPPADETVDLKGVPVPRPFRARARLWAGVAAVTAGVGLVGVLPAVRVPWAGRKAVPPPPGLQISTSPSGASVFVGGVEMGKSPLFLTGLAPGAHAIRIVHAGFAPAELTVETAADSPPMPLRFALQPLTATLKVEAEPPAQVELDGRAIGSTPLAGQRVSAGVHRVVARRRGFRTWIRTVYAGPGETVALEARLSPASGPGGAEDQMRLRNWVRRGDLVKLGPGVEPPRKLAGEPAAVPEAARRLRLKGTVAVELTVTETGDVVDPRVVQSAGEVLDEALLAAVKDWRYEPAEANGVKVRVRIEVRQTFS